MTGPAGRSRCRLFLPIAIDQSFVTLDPTYGTMPVKLNVDPPFSTDCTEI